MDSFLSNQNKLDLRNCITNTNNFIIVTNGRAGSDFIQSCFNEHPEVASTSEKTAFLSNLFDENIDLITHSPDVFATLSVKHLIYSFAPYLNKIEDWKIKPGDKYRSTDINKYINALTYLIKSKIVEINKLNIARFIVLSFAFADGKNISEIKSILIHLHLINQLHHYAKDLKKKDLILVCNRELFDLIASGVFHWRKYWKSQKQFADYINLNQYSKLSSQYLYDHIYIQQQTYGSKSNIRISILNKLSDLNYLNNINLLLGIKKFEKYPLSKVLGIQRRPDLLSSAENLNDSKSFNSKLVERGSPIKRIGIIDTCVLTIISSSKIKFYEHKLKTKIQRKIISLRPELQKICLFILILIPTKIELIYLIEIIPSLYLMINKKNQKLKSKYKKLLLSLILILNYPIEYFKSRFNKMNFFLFHSDTVKYIKELDKS